MTEIEVTFEKNETSIDVHLHYYFEDVDSHSMNAVIHNNCERQFIHYIINKYLDNEIQIEVFAREEGGLKDNLKIILKTAIATTLINSAISTFFTTNFSQKIPITEETKSKLENVLAIKEAIKSNNLTDEEFEYVVRNDRDLRKLKSDFFKTVKQEKKLTKIEVEIPTERDGKPVFDTISVPCSQFNNFILPDDDKTEEENETVDKDAKIFIVAPILIKGRRDLWKGIYNNESIEFKLTDIVFLNDVYNHTIKFSNGTYIVCSIKINTRTNSTTGKVLSTYREVFEVNSHGDEENVPRIIRHKKNGSLSEGPSLFDGIDDDTR
jgi:hypothetical protein